MPITQMFSDMAVGIILLCGFVYVIRLIQAWLLHRTLREAIGRDSPMSPVLIDKIGQSEGGGDDSGDDRNGLVLIAVGLAILGMALIVNDPDWIRYGIGASLFPILVGLVLLGRHLWLRRTDERSLAARP
ncbi:MAG TPA: hypothetical protein VGX37_09555 [Allosphingosinicella sp.]|jgi:hypothetical protein|nr:hypothetical protein [Allosphingosinicella sp.]